MREYLRIAFNRIPIGVQQKHPVTRLVHRTISLPARWRSDHSVYAAPVELWLKNKADKISTLEAQDRCAAAIERGCFVLDPAGRKVLLFPDAVRGDRQHDRLRSSRPLGPVRAVPADDGLLG